jgi:methionyl-tRNA formyltransferase
MENKIKIIFAGTADIATPLLRSLSGDDRFEITSVITQIDKPSGRNLELKPSPVKVAVQELSLPLIQPDSINSKTTLDDIKKQNPDAMIVMAYGQILSSSVLDIPIKGCFNVHASILPKYRGASPVQSALLNNEKETGVSLMQMAERMDNGPVYTDFKIKIDESDNSLTLVDKISALAAGRIPDAIYSAIKGEIKSKIQDEKKATYCVKIKKEDGNINWSEKADRISTKIRAFAGWPGTYTFFKGRRLKIIEAESIVVKNDYDPGTVFKSDGKIFIAAAKGAIMPILLQPEGKTAQTVNDFINGNPDFINSKLTPAP